MNIIAKIARKYFSNDPQVLSNVADILYEEPIDARKLEKEWREKSLSKNDREKIFLESGVSTGEAHQLKTIYLEDLLKEKAKIYYTFKLQHNPLNELSLERAERELKKAKMDYDYHTKFNKSEELNVEQAKQRPLTDFIQFNKANFAPCPFHNEKEPSFKYYPETNTFNCFGGCGGGDVITFIMKRENLNFIQAVKFLQ